MRKHQSSRSHPSAESILQRLASLRDEDAIKGMERFGITSPKAYGISAPVLRTIAREIGTGHLLAAKLWSSGILDARIIAALIDDPKLVTEDQMERWVAAFDNWAICDTCCGNLFDKTSFAWKKAVEWSHRKEEFVKRAGFVLMAELAVHDKYADDRLFLPFLPLIQREATDERNFVKKGVNWALRQIGKRNQFLHRSAIGAAKDIQKVDSPSARWIATDALRELESDAVRKRLRKKRERR